MKKWSQEEIRFLKENYEKLGIEKIAKILNRGYYSIHKKARRLGLSYKNKTWKDEIDFIIENDKAIVDYIDVIKTFNERQNSFAFNYVESKTMREEGKFLKDIAHDLDIPIQTVKNWSSQNTPRAIKCVIKLTKMGILPLTPSKSKKFKLLLKLFGWTFGDGHINKELTNINISGDYDSLENLKKEIKSVFPMIKCHLSTKETEGKFRGRSIKGISSYLIINDSALSRLFHAVGAPKGDKIIQPIKLPVWLFSLNEELKSIFIGALWSTDGTKPIWSKNGFYLCLKLNKSLQFKEEHENFMNDIRRLFDDLGIKTGKVKWRKRPYVRQKDGNLIDSAYFYVSTNLENFLKFNNSIPIFTKDKKEEFEKTFLIMKDKFTKWKDRVDMFYRVKEMFKQGISINEISKELNLPYSTVKVWVRNKHKPFGTRMNLRLKDGKF